MAAILPKSSDGRTFFQSILNFFRNNDVKYSKNSQQASVFKPYEKIQNDEDEEYLSTLEDVELAVNDGTYDQNYWMFIKDVTLALNFIRENFPKSTLMHKKAAELTTIFEREMNDWMREKGYCCGKFYIHYARKITCSAIKKCLVGHNERFYRYNDFTFCGTHFDAFDDQEIQLSDEVTVHRNAFRMFVYEEEKQEDWITCQNCQRMFHERCELFFVAFFAVFLCKNCRHPRDDRFHKLKAKDLRSTECDIFITNYLKTKFENYDDLKLTVRMLSSMQKTFTVKRKFIDYRSTDNEIEYTNSTIFTFFQDSEGYEICIFGVFVQLYGADAPKPSRNTAYVSYIDSVKLYPNNERTKIYQLILLGLFEYIKIHGYEKIFIWSCPPSKNDDYIFPSKPKIQKTPNTSHLSQWYRDLIDKGKEFKIVESSEGSESFAYHSDWSKIDNIPLMDGDMWSIRLTEAILAVENEEMKLEKQRTRGGTASYFDKKERIWELLQVQTKGFDQSYFVLTLNGKGKNKVAKSESSVNLNWINNRFCLVDFFCDFKLKFESNREARFATFALLHRVFMESEICRLCKKQSMLNPYLLCSSCNGIASKQTIINLLKN